MSVLGICPYCELPVTEEEIWESTLEEKPHHVAHSSCAAQEEQ